MKSGFFNADTAKFGNQSLTSKHPDLKFEYRSLEVEDPQNLQHKADFTVPGPLSRFPQSQIRSLGAQFSNPFALFPIPSLTYRKRPSPTLQSRPKNLILNLHFWYVSLAEFLFISDMSPSADLFCSTDMSLSAELIYIADMSDLAPKDIAQWAFKCLSRVHYLYSIIFQNLRALTKTFASKCFWV